jgi:hypothetical protein
MRNLMNLVFFEYPVLLLRKFQFVADALLCFLNGESLSGCMMLLVVDVRLLSFGGKFESRHVPTFNLRKRVDAVTIMIIHQRLLVETHLGLFYYNYSN